MTMNSFKNPFVLAMMNGVLASSVLASTAALNLAVGCSAAEEEPSLEPGEELSIKTEALRPAGPTLSATTTTPWTRRSMMFGQINYAQTASDFDARQNEIEAIHEDYFPSTLTGAKGSSSTRYAATWHKAEKVSGWIWDKRIADGDFGDRYDERGAAGYELYDYSVFLEGEDVFYNTVWVKRTDQAPHLSNRNAASTDIADLDTARRPLGYRLKRVQQYKVGANTRYLGLWTKDGLTDYHYALNKTATDFQDLHATHTANGYHLSDISAFYTGASVRYTGIWIKNSEIRSSAYDGAMTAAEFEEKYQTYLAKNVALVDLNIYYNSTNSLRYAAVWHRTEPNETLQANFTIPAATKTAIENQINVYENDAVNVGDDGRIGFFMQDLQTGRWIGYNMDEPFYMASTTKLLIAAAIIDYGESAWESTTLRASDWRGQANSPFCYDVVAPGLCNTFNGGAQTLDTFLINMLDNSDSASTDRLWGLLEANIPNSLEDYLDDHLGLHNVGEITTICELDKRIWANQDVCAFDVSCDTLENFDRGWVGAYPGTTTQTEQDCMNVLDNVAKDKALHDPYYATLANSITPVEYGRAFHALFDSELSAAEQERLLRVLDDGGGDSGFDLGRGTAYDEMGTKGGSKAHVEGQVGLMWDWNNGVGDYSDVTMRYSFAMYTKLYADDGYSPREDGGMKPLLDMVIDAL